MFRPSRIVPLVLILLFGWMALSVTSRVGVTADETAHLTAGYSYWSAHDYRLQPENGNFPQRWAALPLIVENTPFPALNNKSWDRADVWDLGRKFFFGMGNDTDQLLLTGRAMIVLLGMALAALAYIWSRQLFGQIGGLITLGFVVFCPHLLAHSALITSDIAATLGFLIALAAWWKLCHRITVGRIVFAGLAAGFLALAKYSAALFAPVALLILIVRVIYLAPLPWAWRQSRGRLRSKARIGGLLAAGLGAALIAITVIWSAYGFRYAASADGKTHFVKPWSEVLIEQPRISGSPMADGKPLSDPVHLQAGPVQGFVRWARDYHVLPEGYLYGLAFTDLHARGRLAYFAGDYRETGWWEFFPVAFILKTTLPALLLFGLAFLAFARTKPRIRSRLLYRLSPLLLFTGIYWIFAITSHLNIGHRHLLPIYPPLFIIAGIVGSQLIRRRSRVWLLAAGSLLAWHTAESAWVRPHYLTYFNELAGGPTGGHRYFVDSSLDWGQGLPDLSAWLNLHRGNDPVYLSYFGSDDPQRFRINATRIGDVYFDFASRPILPPLTEGIYCISATMLHRVYTQVRGPWSAEYEHAYQTLSAKCATFNGGPISENQKQQLLTLEQLRFGRLCRYLAHRKPNAIVANSIFIYRLSPIDLALALQGLPRH